jgi:hypothetical protein
MTLLVEAVLEPVKIYTIKTKCKFLRKMMQKKIIFNILNRNIRRDLTNKTHRIIKYLKLETVKTL